MKALNSGILAVAAASFLAAAPVSWAAGPFGPFAGGWSGAGTITTKDGNRERLRCRSSNTEAGNTMRLTLRCASDSYRFELASDIRSDGANLSGNWSETSRNVYGSLTGKMTGNSIQAIAQSAAFTAQISIAAHGSKQSVLIQSPGSEISEVSISMSRGGR